ncbi:uncharacterized protein cubi_00639 [Cryptosporidium ubiquitum]|uniref:Uncharacterized protein n=1 Tax=Cryptosporidium ubiquitum TaxID=857276 RepID=A0A1J4MCX8_9CRYT|nr:uncharacterized protein cubi_00639 [Cryptosporidium ubiquitum]OII71831.1 hypothetical protein cubi_00639 [Cryptosporidium ubiquitum]
MIHEQIRNFAITILFFIGIIENFSNLILEEGEITFCFTQIGIRRNFVNPYRHQIIVNPYSDEKNDTSCCSKRCYSSSKGLSCRICHSNLDVLNCNSCTNSFNSCSGSFGHSDSCSNLFSSNANLTKLRGIHKDCSSKICKCCNSCNSCKYFKMNEDDSELESEVEAFGKFNESSEISSESEISETINDFEIKTNETSSSNEVKLSYDIYLKIMDKYPLLSIKRRNYIRMRQNLINLQQYGLWEIPRDPENSVNETRKIFCNREQYLGLTMNHTNRDLPVMQFIKEPFLKFPNNLNNKDNNSTIIQSSIVPEHVNWGEWEKRNKELNKIVLGNKLGELFNTTAEREPCYFLSNQSKILNK